VSARRLFLALPLPATAQAELRSLAHALKRVAPGVRWVRPEQLHVTLRFLGDVEEAQCNELIKSMNRVTDTAPFTFNLTGVGAFPNRRQPRVVWTGVGEGKEQVTALAALVENAVKASGLPGEDRSFAPHITLGRVRDSADFTAFWQAAEELKFVGQPVHAMEVRLVWSTLTPAGPVYRDVESFPLRGRINQHS
jgi:RNA 2',3'-cyclic 3'-phosphodiesterase